MYNEIWVAWVKESNNDIIFTFWPRRDYPMTSDQRLNFEFTECMIYVLILFFWAKESKNDIIFSLWSRRGHQMTSDLWSEAKILNSLIVHDVMYIEI